LNNEERVVSTTSTSAFPSPLSIETPEGCEGWEEMYPYYALLGEDRREADEQRLWFWNSMHFPEPMSAFDVVAIDGPYYALANWQNRVFAIPPAMGIDYRIVNGYVFITPNAVTDPDLIAERAAFFGARAGYYFANWDELYGRWREKMSALIAEITALEVPSCDTYEDDAVAFEDRDTSFVRVLDAYNRALRMHEQMWQHHFEFLLLGYGAYLTFSDFCKSALPEIPDQHIAQMVSGIDVLLFRPDTELRHLARLARDAGVDASFSNGRSPEEIVAELGQSEAGRGWLEALEAVKDPWFNMGSGDGFYHHHRSWLDDPAIPSRRSAGTSTRSPRAATPSGRPSSWQRSATASRRSTARCSTSRRAEPSTSCSGSREPCSPTSRSTSSSANTGSSRASSTRSASSAGCWRRTASCTTARTSSSSRATRSARRSRSSS
jgi:pyruvate,water dikinase